MNDKCPKCGFKPLKYWFELNDDEKLAASVKLTPAELVDRKNLRICIRCWTTQSTQMELA